MAFLIIIMVERWRSFYFALQCRFLTRESFFIVSAINCISCVILLLKGQYSTLFIFSPCHGLFQHKIRSNGTHTLESLGDKWYNNGVKKRGKAALTTLPRFRNNPNLFENFVR